MSKQTEVILACNFYQPERTADHHRLRGINPDPVGVNWTQVVKEQCYDPLERLGVLYKVSYNIYGTLDHDLGNIDARTQKAFRSHLRENGIADTHIHALLPDLPRKDKEILVRAGTDRFEHTTGVRPRFMWLPEAAVDTEALEVLKEYDIEGFFCSPDQVLLKDGTNASNIPTRIFLRGGQSILALPFHKKFSDQLAFDNEARSNAYRFADEVIRPALDGLKNGCPLVGYIDGETLGHHMRWGAAFADTLVNHALPSRGINVVSVNTIDFNKVTIAGGKIKERSAWSCPDGDLARWHGGWECKCCAGGMWFGKGSFITVCTLLTDQLRK